MVIWSKYLIHAWGTWIKLQANRFERFGSLMVSLSQSASYPLTSMTLHILGLLLHVWPRQQDVHKLTIFFTAYNPFSLDPTVHWFITGVVPSTSANADDAQSTGVKAMEDILDQEVNEYIPSVSQSKNISSLSRDWCNRGEWREGICEPTTTISPYECGYIY